MLLQYLNSYNLWSPNKSFAKTFYKREDAVSMLVIIKQKDNKKSDQSLYRTRYKNSQLFIFDYGMIRLLEILIERIIKWWKDKQLRKKILGYKNKMDAKNRKQLQYASYTA